MNDAVSNRALMLGRVLMAALFIVERLSKIRGYDAALEYMRHFSVPAALLPLAITVELGGGILLAIGWQAKWAALVLAGFSVSAAFLFHANIADHGQLLHLEKDLAIAGGLLAFFAYGPGRFSVLRTNENHQTSAVASPGLPDMPLVFSVLEPRCWTNL